eukprot:CAMPEP_0184656772 /NCGR_PEP_ID=MMETSP0308-20130426/16743_1 /TAXON_ID=38269 /ORGANISM="Gloeochaete witrockiana, Strain SAG 46.84" /LENGTH=119 /DNA_ID=CAMNT_0027094039 /DNA_START=210 /DNA_END=569 /DNA_ORIENTATION=-
MRTRHSLRMQSSADAKEDKTTPSEPSMFRCIYETQAGFSHFWKGLQTKELRGSAFFHRRTRRWRVDVIVEGALLADYLKSLNQESLNVEQNVQAIEKVINPDGWPPADETWFENRWIEQ